MEIVQIHYEILIDSADAKSRVRLAVSGHPYAERKRGYERDTLLMNTYRIEFLENTFPDSYYT